MGKDTSLCPNGMDVAKLTHKKVLQTLENGVRFGKWILLENIGEVGEDNTLHTIDWRSTCLFFGATLRSC